MAKRKVKEPVEVVKYKIIRDTQEKVNTWNFIKSKYCDGTIDESLWTGDYTIQGMENIFSIERKASTGEIAGNVWTKQFLNELKRADKLKHFWVICEFSLKDILNFPYNSGIPKRIWPRLKVNATLILKKIIEFETNHNVKFIFAENGEVAKEAARAIFKRMIEMYGDKVNAEEINSTRD